MKRRNWTEQECRIVISAYFEMLNLEQSGKKYSKAGFSRKYVPMLDNRTKGSYEMKLMNITSAIVSMNQEEGMSIPTIGGYKPYGNSQKLLKQLIREHLRLTA